MLYEVITEFVVYVLQGVFHHTEAEATQIMLHVHKHGLGVALFVQGSNLGPPPRAQLVIPEELGRPHGRLHIRRSESDCLSYNFV